MGNYLIMIILFIKGNGNKVSNQGKENIHIHQEITIKEIGKIIYEMEKELWCGLIQIKNMLDIGKMIYKIILDIIFGWNNKNKAGY